MFVRVGEGARQSWGVRAVSVVMSVVLGLGLYVASPALRAEDKVYSPYVEQGEVELEFRGHTTFDSDPDKNDQQAYKLEAGYGVTAHWFTAIGSEIENDANNGLQYESTFWENIIQFGEQGEYWVDSGLYVEYHLAKQAGTPDELETKLLLEKASGNFVNTANLALVWEYGSNASSATNFEFAWKTTYFISARVRPGFEAYAEVGELGHPWPADQQDNRIGPVVCGDLERTSHGKLKYEVGYLFGVSDAAPNGTLKFELEYEFWP